MRCNKEFMINLQLYNLESVTFANGANSTMIGNGLLKVPSMSKLENVLLVNELKVNLISALVNCVIIIYLSNLLKKNAQPLIELTHVLWKEKDH